MNFKILVHKQYPDSMMIFICSSKFNGSNWLGIDMSYIQFLEAFHVGMMGTKTIVVYAWKWQGTSRENQKTSRVEVISQTGFNVIIKKWYECVLFGCSSIISFSGWFQVDTEFCMWVIVTRDITCLLLVVHIDTHVTSLYMF